MPVILFVDGHCTHLTFQLRELCTELGIILIALYPNTTRLLQPLDIASFRPLKTAWKKAVLEWYRENRDLVLNKEWFAPVLTKALQMYSLEQSAIHGFCVCGLFPWNQTRSISQNASAKKQLHTRSPETIAVKY